MELVEPIERINYLLERDFRKIENRPEYRLVWANDQLEKRWVTHTDEGFELIHPEVREVKKYQNDSVDRFVLERLTPITGETDLVDRLSYEPVWTFQDRHGNYLPPRFDACKIIIEQIEENINSAGKPKPKIIDESMTEEGKLKELQRVEEILFGNESPVSDALAYRSGVAGFNYLGDDKKEKVQ